MMLSNSKLRTYTIFLADMILIAVFVWALLSIKIQNAETKTLLQATENAGKEERLALNVRHLKATAGTEIEAFEERMLMEENVVSIIESIESAGKDLGVALEILSVDKVEGEKPQKLNISLEAKGSWDSIFSFIRSVESLPQRVSVENIDLHKEGSGWRIQLSFTLLTFD